MLKILYERINGWLEESISSASSLLPIDLDTLAILQANVNFNAGEWTYLLITEGTLQEEVKVTGISSNYLVVERGASGSTPRAFTDTALVTNTVGSDGIRDIVAASPITSNVTVAGTGIAEVTNTGDAYNVHVAPATVTGSDGIVVTGSYPDFNVALEGGSGGCCGGSGGGGGGGSGVTEVQVDSTILQANILGSILSLSLPTPTFAGAGTVVVTGSYPNFTITGGGGGGGGTTVSVGSGLVLTGDPSVNPNIAIANTGVTAGDYGGFVVNARGQITQIPVGWNPISEIVLADGGTVARLGNTATITLDNAGVAVKGIVALADELAPLDENDTESAVTPALLAAVLSSSSVGAQAAGSSTGEADALYTDVRSGTALTVSLAVGKKAIILAECEVLDGTTPLTPVAFGMGVFTAASVKLYGSKICTQSKQTIVGVINGPLASTTISLVLTAIPGGSSVQSESLSFIPI